MKLRPTIFMVLFVLQFGATAQKAEFPVYNDGLIYSDSTMKVLRFIIDSLNLKYKNCGPQKKYYAMTQANCDWFEINALSLDSVMRDLKMNTSCSVMRKKYPRAFSDSNLLLFSYKYVGYQNDTEEEYCTLPLSFSENRGHYSVTIEKDTSSYYSYRNGKWVIWFRPYSDILPEDIMCGFYLNTEFESKELPYEYARMAGYSDCMIDTSTDIFIRDAKPVLMDQPDSMPASIRKFIYYVWNKTGRPEYDSVSNQKNFRTLLWRWDKELNKLTDSLLSDDEAFRALLHAAADEAIEKNMYSEYLEYCSSKMYSPEKTLELKRRRIVTGHCSADASPRIHAMEIALLAAETHNWNIFLRAHLDIMNDHFQRVSDGSYAYKERQTYIRELEDLDIDVTDLLLGTCLMIENPAPNHYFSSTTRVGRALAESKFPDEVEAKVLGMIRDERLDDLNRVNAYFLFTHYNHYLTDSKRYEANKRKLEEAVNSLPLYISQRITRDNYIFENEMGGQYEPLKKHFNISGSYAGSRLDSLDKYWMALLQDAADTVPLYIKTEFSYDIVPGSVQPVIDNKDRLFNTIRPVAFLMDSIRTGNFKIEISYEYGNTFSGKDQEEFLKYLPPQMTALKNIRLSDVIHFKVACFNRWNSDYEWLIFPDGQLMLWKYCCRTSPLLKYTEEQIRVDNDGSGIQVFKYFDYSGNIVTKK